MEGTIRFTIKDDIGIVVLSNPPDNLLTPIMVKELKDIQSFVKNKAVKALLIHGDGNHFCAGSAETIADAKDFNNRLKECCAFIAYAPVPVVAAIQGSCLDAGFLLAMHCHTIFASPSSLMGFHKKSVEESFDQSILPSLKLKQSIKHFEGTVTGSKAEQQGLVEKAEGAASVIQFAEHYVQSLVENRSLKLIHAVMESIHNERRLPYMQALHQESVLFDAIVKSAATETIIGIDGKGNQS